MTTPAPSDSSPALWNPNAAACWSLLFSPAFGAFLHARNAELLGRTDEAKANRVWFYASLTFLGLATLSVFVPAIPDIIFRGAGIGLLVGWYSTLGRKQIQYVKDTWQERYQRKILDKAAARWVWLFGWVRSRGRHFGGRCGVAVWCEMNQWPNKPDTRFQIEHPRRAVPHHWR